MISLKDFITEPDSVAFNDGAAGRYKGATVSVRRKKPEDKDGFPDISVDFVDSEGGKVNLGVYYPTDKTNEKEIHIRMTQLVDIWRALNPDADIQNIPDFASHKEAYDFLSAQIAKTAQSGAKVNVFVSYGTIKNPSRYLGFRAFSIVEPASTPDEKTRLVPNNYPESNEKKYPFNDIMSRLEPTATHELEEGEDTTEEPVGW